MEPTAPVCPNCGEAIEVGAAFCSRCGARRPYVPPLPRVVNAPEPYPVYPTRKPSSFLKSLGIIVFFLLFVVPLGFLGGCAVLWGTISLSSNFLIALGLLALGGGILWGTFMLGKALFKRL